MLKHTKGTWIVKETLRSITDPIFYHTSIVCGGKRIARASGIGIDEAEANARLIAAAPDLLEACRHGAISIHHPACSHGKKGDGNTCECHVKKCQQAIKKAENHG